jgi:hypothetical protein
MIYWRFFTCHSTVGYDCKNNAQPGSLQVVATVATISFLIVNDIDKDSISNAG